MSQDVEVHNLAVRIYDALNKKGASLGNASVFIIESVIEESAQQSVQADLPSVPHGQSCACNKCIAKVDTTFNPPRR